MNAEQERQNPRFFNSVVNHISEVDFASENPSKLDGEHFLVTVDDDGQVIDTSPEKENEEKKAT